MSNKEEQNTDDILRIGDEVFLKEDHESLFTIIKTDEDDIINENTIGEIAYISYNADFTRVLIRFNKINNSKLHNGHGRSEKRDCYWVSPEKLIKRCHKRIEEESIDGIKKINTTIKYKLQEGANSIYDINKRRHVCIIRTLDIINSLYYCPSIMDSPLRNDLRRMKILLLDKTKYDDEIKELITEIEEDMKDENEDMNIGNLFTIMAIRKTLRGY